MTGLDDVFNFSTDLGDKQLAVISSANMRNLVSVKQPTRMLTSVHVPRSLRGQGHGSRVLDAFCELADQYQVDVYVDPRPHDACPLSMLDLFRWYERRDFVPFGGIYRRSARKIQMTQAYVSPKMQKLLDELTAQPKPAFNIEDYRVSPEAKDRGDRQVAANIRANFPGIIILHTDAQLADAFEVARNDPTFDPNFGNGDSKKFFLELVNDINGGEASEPEPGEHQEVIDAINGCNPGEDE